VARFTDYLELPADLNLGSHIGNCAVVATAIFCGLPYQEVESFYRNQIVWGTQIRRLHSRYAPEKWGNPKHKMSYGIFDSEIRRALNKLNKRRSVSFRFDGTLGAFARDAAKEGVRYYVVTTGHAQVLQNGIVIDQGGPVNYREHWGRRKRVKFIIAMK